MVILKKIKANLGRIINAIDILPQIARGFASSSISAVMIPGRAAAGAAGILIGIPVTAAIVGAKFFLVKSPLSTAPLISSIYLLEICFPFNALFTRFLSMPAPA